MGGNRRVVFSRREKAGGKFSREEGRRGPSPAGLARNDRATAGSWPSCLPCAGTAPENQRESRARDRDARIRRAGRAPAGRRARARTARRPLAGRRSPGRHQLRGCARTGDSYLAPVELPYVPGNEVVGTVDGGRRVAGLCRGGGYAERTLLHRRVTWDIPDAISDEQAVALALQGNSAWHLLFTSLRLTEGETVVVPAAAGASDRWPSSSPRAPAPGSSLSRAPRKSANWPGNWAPTRWWTRPPRI